MADEARHGAVNQIWIGVTEEPPRQSVEQLTGTS
jgi:hypothetical protein